MDIQQTINLEIYRAFAEEGSNLPSRPSQFSLKTVTGNGPNQITRSVNNVSERALIKQTALYLCYKRFLLGLPI
jgi:hypothetical protein